MTFAFGSWMSFTSISVAPARRTIDFSVLFDGEQNACPFRRILVRLSRLLDDFVAGLHKSPLVDLVKRQRVNSLLASEIAA